MSDIDWDFWLNMPTVRIWQACALSLNIDPEKMKQHPDGYMTPEGFLFKDESFKTNKEKDEFNKRLRLLSSHVINIVTCIVLLLLLLSVLFIIA